MDPDLFVTEEPQFAVDLISSKPWLSFDAFGSRHTSSSPEDSDALGSSSGAKITAINSTHVGLTLEQQLTLPPWIPAFCLGVNKWGFVLVGDYLEVVKWNQNSISQLELPETTKALILQLVEGIVAMESLPSSSHQIISMKGRGLNILLHGDPGVGKTTTAGMSCNRRLT